MAESTIGHEVRGFENGGKNLVKRKGRTCLFHFAVVFVAEIEIVSNGNPM
jgi:hypothetical protein